MNTEDTPFSDDDRESFDTVEVPLGETIVSRVEAILTEAQRASRPIELEPYRGRLFELFVTADAAGYLADDSEVDLSADGRCRQLGERWGLADATRASMESQQKLPADQLAQMRLLWSVLRMWMEWRYAWERWSEFHE